MVRLQSGQQLFGFMELGFSLAATERWWKCFAWSYKSIATWCGHNIGKCSHTHNIGVHIRWGHCHRLQGGAQEEGRSL